MKLKLSYILDSVGNRYIGFDIPITVVEPFLVEMANDIENNNIYNEYIEYKSKRDGEHKYHITVINAFDTKKLTESTNFIELQENLFDTEYTISLIGLGKVNKNENEAYFIVVKCEGISLLQKYFGLTPTDLHITIGFKFKDVFGVRKNETLKSKSNFSRMLRRNYFDFNETMNFVKVIDGYDYDQNAFIETIKIYDTYAIYRIANSNSYFQVSDINGNLTISGKWESGKQLPIYSQTLIYQKMLNQ
jgi:hypothetical protein